jgi:xanthine dehydrogenase accessory factor
MSLHRLLQLFERVRVSDEPLVLATVIRTGGSTYAKPGAQMLVATDGEYAGLLSGGCLEGDLREHAREVAATGVARIVSYDLRSTADDLFGLGAGCEGAMDILLTRHRREEDWQPLPRMGSSFRDGSDGRVVFVTASGSTELPLGVIPPGDSSLLRAIHAAAAAGAPNSLIEVGTSGVQLFIAVVTPAPRILLLGGGPDARPVAQLCAFLGWRVSVVEHRAVYLTADRFPPLTELIEIRASELASAIPLDAYSAAIVMSHHLESDLNYLRALAVSRVPYVGLLGPAARRERLLADLGADAGALRLRLRAPVGLDIGGRTPESIALAIVGEVHAALAGRAGGSFSAGAH